MHAHVSRRNVVRRRVRCGHQHRDQPLFEECERHERKKAHPRRGSVECVEFFTAGNKYTYDTAAVWILARTS